MERYNDRRSSSRPPPHQNTPTVNSIYRGTVSRIESYGVFVELEVHDDNNNRRRRPPRGLVHASQLAAYRIEKIEDAVSVNDNVWVKVLDVEITEEEDGRTKTRLSLSMKYVNQDTGDDLDPDGSKAEDDQQRRGRRSDRGGGDIERDNVPSALEQSLNSNIGMGVAIDPLAAMRQAAAAVKRGKGAKNRYVLNADASSNGQADTATGGSGSGGGTGGPILFNGYALVDDEEGEVETKEQTATTAPSVSSPTLAATASMPKKPLGRGRGTTLPAWMTQSNPNGNSADGPIGSNNVNDGEKTNVSKRRSRSRSRSFSTSEDSDRLRHRRRKDRKRHKKRKEKHRRHRGERRKRSRHDGGESDYDSESTGGSSGRRQHRRRKYDRVESRQSKERSSSSLRRSKSERKSRHHHRKDEGRSSRRHHRGKRRSRSHSRSRSLSSRSSDRDDDSYDSRRSSSRRDDRRRSRSKRVRNSYDDIDSGDESAPFKNVEEAKELIARLQRKKESERKDF